MYGEWISFHDLLDRLGRYRKSQNPNAVAIASLRIIVGAFFTVFGEYKVFGIQFVRHGFVTYLQEFLHGGAYPFMIPVLKAIVAHAAVPMAIAVAYGEFLIGISLVIGVWSRVASIFGFLLMTAMCLSGGYPGEHAAFWMYWGASLNWSVLAGCFAVLALGRPEEVLSLRHLGRRTLSSDRLTAARAGSPQPWNEG